MIVDYHMHLRKPESGPGGSYSADYAEEYVSHARGVGVDEIGFTEHIFKFRESKGLWQLEWMRERCTDGLDDYVDAVQEAKSRGLPVKLGLEVDYFPGIERELVELLEPYPWDFLLGSVHFVDGFAVDQEPGLVHRIPVGEAWRRYFVWLRDAARSGLFDCLSHPDLIKFFGMRAIRGGAALPVRRDRRCDRGGRRLRRGLDRGPVQAGRRALSRPRAARRLLRARSSDHARLGRA